MTFSKCLKRSFPHFVWKTLNFKFVLIFLLRIRCNVRGTYDIFSTHTISNFYDFLWDINNVIDSINTLGSLSIVMLMVYLIKNTLWHSSHLVPWQESLRRPRFKLFSRLESSGLRVFQLFPPFHMFGCDFLIFEFFHRVFFISFIGVFIHSRPIPQIEIHKNSWLYKLRKSL